jgi:microcompartment protein CcmK/EutM
MRIAKIIGTVTLNRCHPSYRGANLQFVAPYQTCDLVGDREPTDEELVAWDDLGAGLGALIALSEGTEAGQPFRPDLKPVDAYVAAVIDQLDVDQALLRPMGE